MEGDRVVAPPLFGVNIESDAKAKLVLNGERSDDVRSINLTESTDSANIRRRRGSVRRDIGTTYDFDICVRLFRGEAPFSLPSTSTSTAISPSIKLGLLSLQGVLGCLFGPPRLQSHHGGDILGGGSGLQVIALLT